MKIQRSWAVACPNLAAARGAPGPAGVDTSGQGPLSKRERADVMARGGKPISDGEILVLRDWFARQCLAMSRRLNREGRPEEAARWAADAEKYGPSNNGPQVQPG